MSQSAGIVCKTVGSGWLHFAQNDQEAVLLA